MSLFKKSQKETVLILDIGNGSVGAALAELSKVEKPKIFFSHREPVYIQAENNSERIIASMLKLLDEVLAITSKQSRVSIAHVCCILSSPWYMSQTKTIKIEKQKPFVVTKHFVENVVKNEENIFRTALLNGSYGHLFPGPVRVIEHHSIETRLNGYGVDIAFGKKAHSLELSLFTSVVAEEIIKDIEQAITKHFHSHSFSFYSFSLVSFSTIRDMYPHDQDFMFLDITGEVTDVSITRKNVLLETISFPLGRASLLRRLSKTLTVSPQVALSYVRLYAEGVLSGEASEKIMKALSNFEREWCDSFHKSILELSRDIAVPKKIFFTADRDTARFFSRMMAKEKCTEFPGGDSEQDDVFDIAYLDSEKLAPFVDRTSRTEKDEFLALESVFLNKLFATNQ